MPASKAYADQLLVKRRLSALYDSGAAKAAQIIVRLLRAVSWAALNGIIFPPILQLCKDFVRYFLMLPLIGMTGLFNEDELVLPGGPSPPAADRL